MIDRFKSLSTWIERRKSDCGPYSDYIIEAVQGHEAEIERLRAGLEDIRDYKGYRSPAHFRRRAAVILKEGQADAD